MVRERQLLRRLPTTLQVLPQRELAVVAGPLGLGLALVGERKRAVAHDEHTPRQLSQQKLEGAGGGKPLPYGGRLHVVKMRGVGEGFIPSRADSGRAIPSLLRGRPLGELLGEEAEQVAAHDLLDLAVVEAVVEEGLGQEREAGHVEGDGDRAVEVGAEGDVLDMLKARFEKVRHAKPDASRAESAETYLVATGFRV